MPETESNRRNSHRFTVDSVAEIMVRGFTIEFPTKDISEGGACLDSLGVTQIRPGELCYLLVGDDEEIRCEVVEITRTNLRLKFLNASTSEVMKHFGLAEDDEDDGRAIIGTL